MATPAPHALIWSRLQITMDRLSKSDLRMSLFALGISHQTAPVAIRERLAFPPDALPEALTALHALPGIEECAIISTCNRTELYASADERSMSVITEWLHAWHELPPGRYQEYLYTLTQNAAIIHLFKVTAGMDSMVLGEPQVTGQVKLAWQAASERNTLGTKLDRLFQHSFACAKRVRTETSVGRNPVSLPKAALRLARQILGDVDQLRALMIGAGEMIDDCASHFVEHGLAGLTIANRSPERAANLAARYGAESCDLEELPERLSGHDIVVACTASSTPVLEAGMFRRAVKERRHRPMFVLDLAVPRNVNPAVSEFEDVYLYTIDDLREIVEAGQRERVTALPGANQIVRGEALVFERWLNLQATNQALKTLRRRAYAERDQLLAEARTELAAGRDPEAVLKRLGHRLANRLLHGPSIRLRQAGEIADEELLNAARFFFLDEES